MAASRAVAIAFAVAVAGCGAGTSTLTLTVAASGPINGVSHLRLFVTTMAGQRSKEADFTVAGGTIPPSLTVPLKLPASVKGKTTISVDAMPATGTTPLASASGSVTINPSTTATLTLTLPGGAMPMGDMAMPAAGPPAQLAFTTQPSDTAVGVAVKPAVTVAIEDASGVIVTSANTPITIALGANPGNAVLGGTLTVTPANGVASFADLTLDADADGYTLAASASMLTGATSSPFNVRAPVWTQATNGIFGGVVNVVVAAGTPTVMYAGTRDSGAFVSSNGGASWSGIPNGLPLKAINWLAIDPASTMHVFAATDDGVYATSNGGAAWTLAFDPAAGTSFQSVAIDPATPADVFVSVPSKVYKSTDGGKTFVDDSTGLGTGNIFSLAVGAQGVLATLFNEAMSPSNGGVYRQPNAGGSWARDSSWPNGSASFDGSYPRKVATTANGGVAIAVGDARNFLDGNGLATGWTEIATTSLQAPNGTAAAIDPAAPTHFYVGGAGAPAACGMCAGIWHSEDGGSTWNAYGGALGLYSPTAIAIDDNGGNVFAATSAGLFKQALAGGNNPAATNAGLTAYPIFALAADGSVFAGSTLANVFKTTDGAMNWGPSSGTAANVITGTFGNVTALAFDPTTSMTVYAGQSMSGVWKSTDGGANWSNVGNNAGGLTDTSVSCLAIAPADGMLLYAGTSGTSVLFKSTNGGTSWASGNLTAAASITDVVFDPTTSSTLYVSAGTNVYKTSDGGVMWNPMISGLPATSAFTALAVDGASNTTVYVANAGAVYKSTDGAMTWNATGTFSAGAVRALAAHPTKAGVVYAATDQGVFRTVDGGTNWAAFNVGLGNIDVDSVVFDRADPTLVYVGTGGGGVYKATP